MRLKKLLLLALLLGCTHDAAFAQKGIFIGGLNVGYGFRAAPNAEQSYSSNTTTSVKYNLGNGFNGALTGAYMFGEHIGAGLDIGYLLSAKTHLEDNGSNSGSSLDMTAKMLSFTPNIRLSANSGKINPYCKFGLVIGSPTITWKESESGSGARAGNSVLKLYGNMAIGWYGAFGLQYALSDKMMLNAELFSRNVSFAPKTAENTETYVGEQKEPTYTFVKTVDKSSSATTINQMYFPISSVGIMVGINIMLGGNK